MKSTLFLFVNLTKYLQMSVNFKFFHTAQCCNLLNSKEKCGWKALYSIYIVLGNFKGDFLSAFSLHLEFSFFHLESVRNIPIYAEKKLGEPYFRFVILLDRALSNRGRGMK